MLTARGVAALDTRYDSLDLYANHLPAKGSIAAALHVLQRLRASFELDIRAHVAEGETQVAGLSARAVQAILGAYGEHRVLSAIGGRSNRGARGDVVRLLDAIRTLHLDGQPAEVREAVLVALQRHIVENQVSRFFVARRVKASYERGMPVSVCVETLLRDAKEAGKGGAVAEHLVGAKLALRYPHLQIRSKPHSGADQQHGFAGDFEIGDTVFHVTFAPMPELFEKIRSNLRQGFRVYVLVPNALIVGTEQTVTALELRGVDVRSIEYFVATNIDELAGFDGDATRLSLGQLLATYNRRVDEVERDKSLLIDVPRGLE